MRITNLEVTNFQGLRHAALVVSEPLLLVAGHNGAGKSSLLDAISMAITGQPRRVNLKKDIGQLLTEGEKRGIVHLDMIGADGTETACGVQLPSGKGTGLAPSTYQPYVLDATLFSALDGKERRKMLFDLSGVKVKPDEVTAKLIERGADAKLADQVKPMLRAGFPAAAEQAKDGASEARGAWKAITGEAYGSLKADGWKPDLPPTEVSQADLDAAAKAQQQLDEDLADASETLGTHKAAAQQASQLNARIAELKELAELVERRQQKLDRDTGDLTHWTSQLEQATAAASGGKKGLIHDMARTLAEFEEIVAGSDGYAIDDNLCRWPSTKAADMLVNVMEAYRAEHGVPDAVASAEEAKRVPEYQGYVDNITRTVNNSQRDLDQAKQAAATLAELEQNKPTALPANAIESAEELITKLRQDRDAARAKFEALNEASKAYAEYDQVIAKAAEHHAAVKSWTLIAEALAPDGIPAEILASALGPFNELLANLSGIAGWAEVTITDAIDITAGGRQYGLLSESEKWRADTLLTLAIAHLSGERFVMIDRLDVLDLPSRSQAIKLMMNVTQTDLIDQVIVAGTLKAPMAKVPDGMQAMWLEGGSSEQQQAAAA